jgi:RHH-type transcriptional regulator, rel operon repressor / antitoxin RelB
MLALRLPPSLEKHLEKLARRTGRTKTYHVRKAIREHLENMVDIKRAERALQRIRKGDASTIPLQEVMNRYGLEDGVNC